MNNFQCKCPPWVKHSPWSEKRLAALDVVLMFCSSVGIVFCLPAEKQQKGWSNAPYWCADLTNHHHLYISKFCKDYIQCITMFCHYTCCVFVTHVSTLWVPVCCTVSYPSYICLCFVWCSSGRFVFVRAPVCLWVCLCVCSVLQMIFR